MLFPLVPVRLIQTSMMAIWKDKIIEDNSPEVGDNSAESCEISGPASEGVVDKETELVPKAQNQRSKFQVALIWRKR